MAESLDKSTDEMKDKKIPESYFQSPMHRYCIWRDFMIENERRFVILTTAVNEPLIKIHDRKGRPYDAYIC